ncbi:hypothetical protein MMC30_008240 [Trapelia coarctata]|nr:hypothetical protein [Trapelia coarctata]
MATLIFDESSPPRPLHQKPQLLPHIVDGMARARPQAPYAELPVSPTSYDEGFVKVNYAAFANLVNGLAWWLKDTLGVGENFETLAYIGPNDVRYNGLMLAAVKTGYKTLFTSPRNSIPAHGKLFESLDCRVLITSSPRPPVVNAIVSAHPLRVLEVPSLQDLLTTAYPHYPYNKTFLEARNEPLVVLHTSGTTGFPKPVIWTHDWAAAYQKLSMPDAPEGYTRREKLFQGNRMISLLPPFHCGSLYSGLLPQLYNQTTVIFPLSGAIPSARLLVEGLKHTKADIALLAPPFVEEVCKNPELLEFLTKNLDSIFYAGGDIPQAYGDALHSKMKNFFTVIATTEAGMLPTLMTGADWKYFQFHPQGGIELRNHSENLYEACILRKQGLDEEQPVFKLFPDLKEFPTGDLYTPHPTKPDLWAYHGRADDTLVFLTGEKTNPVTMEHHVSKHPEVRAVLVAGTMRFQAALLVELMSDKPLSVSKRAEVIERLWPTIQEANSECPAHAKIAKSHILFVSPDKLMQRAGKGTIQRKPTLELYSKELDALYDDAEKMSATLDTDNDTPGQTIDVRDTEKVSSFIRETVAEITGWIDFNDSQNLFILGMDSLQALTLTRKLKQSLALLDLAITTIYINPSVAALTKAISELSLESGESKMLQEQSRQQKISSTLQDFEAVIGKIGRPKSASSLSNGVTRRHSGRVVVLTGSTGALGSYILGLLQDHHSVGHIFCLNRSSDSRSLQSQRNKARGLPAVFPAERVTFLTADLSKSSLSLEPRIYQDILENATDIIHNAWPVNFNVSLTTFQPHLAGVINLIDLAASGSNSPSILFVSSISSVSNYSGPSLKVPEQIIQDITAPLPIGYGESKYAAERLLGYASSKLGIHTKVARVGQIAGPVDSAGKWSKSEWLPSLVISSLHIGALPESLGSNQSKIDWVPIDILAHVLIDLAFSDYDAGEAHQAQVFHPLNPRETTWTALLPAVLRSFASIAPGKNLEIVSFEEWLQYLRAEARKVGGAKEKVELEALLDAVPAVKLLGFFEGLTGSETWPGLESGRAREGSERLRDLEAVRAEWMEGWTRGWFA